MNKTFFRPRLAIFVVLAMVIFIFAQFMPALPKAKAAAVAAFPGAQGFGASASGGRGGRVVFVTNTNDSGSGSLRDCVNQSGARICEFRVGGTIVLNSQLNFTNPYITVAGQTAPGGGITIEGLNVIGTDPVRISTHDVIIQYVRIGVGYRSDRTDQTGDAISIYGGVSNVIVDHVSLRWGQDETFQLWNNGGGITNVTLSNSLLADPNSVHSTFLIAGGGNSSLAAMVTNNDWHHNLILTGSHRIPLAKAGNDSLVNNIIYNWGFYANQFLGGGKHDIIGNIYKKGPYTNSSGYGSKHEIEASSSFGADALDGSPTLYVSGNKGWNQSDPSGNQIAMTSGITGENGSENGAVPSSWFVSLPSNHPAFPITPDSANNLDNTLLPHVGASRHLDCGGNWVTMRDSLDANWVANYQNGTGSSPGQNSNFPAVSGGTACADTDNDGMFDIWETARGLAVGVDDHNQVTALGFTAIEEFLNPGGNTTPPPSDTSAPTVPANLLATAISSSQINLSWSASTDNVGVSGYKIYRNGTQVGTTVTNSYSDSGLTANTTYTYMVSGYDAAGNVSAQSAAVFVTTSANPPPPTGSCQASSVAWQGQNFPAQTGSFAVSFDVTPGSLSVDAIVGLGNKIAASAIDLAAIIQFDPTLKTINARNGSIYQASANIPYSANTTYHFRLVVNPSAHTYSAYVVPSGGSEQIIGANYAFRSEQLTLSTLSYVNFVAFTGAFNFCNFNLSLADTQAPTVPANLLATVNSSSQINLSWTASTDNVGVTGYKVYRNGNQIGTTATNSYSDTNLAANTSYAYTVSSVDAAGNTSAQSAVAQATTLPLADTTAPIISNVTTASITTSSAVITWITNEAADSQVDYGLTTAYGNSSALNPVLVTSHSVNLSGLSADTTYHFRVKSKDKALNQIMSLDFTFTTLPDLVTDITPPSAVTNLLATNTTRTSTTLSWTAPGDDNNSGIALSYDLRYALTPITETSWLNATKLTGLPLPKVSGTAQSYTAVGLSSGIRYYFALKTQDEANNWSGLSNVLTVITKKRSGKLALSPSSLPNAPLVLGQTTTDSEALIDDSPDDVTAPAKVSSFTASALDSQVALSWINPTDADYVRTLILRKQGTTGSMSPTDGTVVYEGTGTAFVDTQLSNNTAYTYTAFTFDEVPNYSQAVSVTATPKAGQTQVSLLSSSASIVPLPGTGSLKLINDNGTYYLINQGQRQGITSPGILYSYGLEFKDAQIASGTDLVLPLAQSLLLPGNGSLVKSIKDPTVYLISNNQRYAFTSSKVFTAMGFNFNSVLLVTDPELQALPKANPLADSNSAHLPGTDINDNGTIYWIDNNHFKQGYPSMKVFNSWHKDNDFSRVVKANEADKALPISGVVEERVVR